jgi:glutathione S-transferase
MGLLHRGRALEYIEVDPYRKSRGWLEISRGRAKVPVIVTPAGSNGTSTRVIDSTRVLEYHEGLAPDVNPLFPGDAEDRAEMRFWISHANERVVPYVYRYLQAEQPGEYRDELAALIQGTQALTESMSPSGPFFRGRAPIAIDLLLIPFA